MEAWTYILVAFGLCGSVLLGAVTGYFINLKVGVFILSLTCAFILVTMVFTFLVSFTAIWITLGLIMPPILCMSVVLPSKFEAMMRIQTTALIGSFFTVRGLGFMLGGYPSEVMLYTWTYYGYLMP